VPPHPAFGPRQTISCQTRAELAMVLRPTRSENGQDTE